MERLYYKDAYITEFEAAVTDITEKGIVLDRTAFFPEGGGQSSDRGTLSDICVTDVQEDGGVIFHRVADASAFKKGDRVFGKIDFEKRFSDMQNHSGEHIVSGIIHNTFGYDNVGFHLNENEIALDFSGVVPDDRIKEIELSANRVVWDNKEIKILFPDLIERKAIAYRSKKEIEGELRLVEIEGVDMCACCAPHVRRTGEIGLIKIIGHEKHRGGTRIYILCGNRALTDYNMKQSENKKTAVMLKVREYETSEAVSELLKKKNEIEGEIIRLNIEAARREAQNYDKKEIIVAVTSFAGKALTHFVNELKLKAEKLAAAFGKTDENSYQFMLISSESFDLAEFTKRMNSALSGRGGGRGTSVQGSVQCSENEILDFFNKIADDYT